MTKERPEVIAPSEIRPGCVLARIEWAVAIVLTALAVGCHFAVFRYAGALWRDEVTTINLATMPTLADIWNNLQFESFPLAWILIVRAWAAVAGPDNDTALRLLGFLVGLGVLGVIWLAVRKFMKQPFPLLALVLVGFNSGLVFWGDSLRAWGLGSLTIILAAGLLWQVVQEPTRWRIVLAALVSVLAVQTAYHNIPLLLAIGLAAMGVAARRRQWRRVILVGAIGLLAALTLLPYAFGVQTYGGNSNIIGYGQANLSHGNTDFVRYGLEFALLLGSAGNFMIFVWAALIAVGVAAATIAQVRGFSPKLTSPQRDLALFAGLILVVSFAAFAAFLWALNYPTNPWYFLILTVVIAVALEAATGVFLASRGWRIVRLVVVVVLAAACLLCGWEGFVTRQTNLDLIAASLQSRADKDDLIVIRYWAMGTTFDRYYKGPTPWETIPPLKDHKFQRVNQLPKEFWSATDYDKILRTAVDDMTRTLRGGHKVWLVGRPVLRPGLIDRLMLDHALSHTSEKFCDRAIKYENPILEVAEGWRE